MKINVIDAMCGAGKTSAAINYINQTDEETKIMYITPFRDELYRIIEACPEKKFYTPTGKVLTPNLKVLLSKGKNIVTTHQLFKLFDDEIIEMCYSQGYILIMDEVTQVVEKSELTRQDRETLFQKYVETREDGIVVWRDDQADYTGKFDDVKRQTSLEALASYDDNVVLWLFPVKIFRAFEESYILTYMFDAQLQRYYYDFYGMEYRYMYVAGDSVENYHFTETPNVYKSPYEYSKLITILDDRKMNIIGDHEKALSKSWYDANAKGFRGQQLKNNLINFFNNKKVLYCDGGYKKSSVKNNLWTGFNDYKKDLTGKGYASAYLENNARSMNSYSDRSVVAYPINRFMNPTFTQFFAAHGIKVDEDRYALSDMIQWVWRSAIRNGEHITIYIPSYRMRKLLIDWINENSSEPMETGELLVRSM